jgi:hypothetical protein
MSVHNSDHQHRRLLRARSNVGENIAPGNTGL